MQCEAFQDRLNVVLDERMFPSSDPDLLQHANVCTDCAMKLSTCEQMFAVFCSEADEVTTFDTDKTTVALREVSQEGGNRLFTRSLLAVAAMIMIAASASWFKPPANPTPYALLEEVAAPQDTALIVESPVASTGDVVASPAEVQDRLSEFASLQDSSSAFVHQPILSLGLLSTADWRPSMQQVSMPFGARLPDVEPRWIEAVTDGVSPVQQSMNRTLAAIRKSLSS